MFELLKLRAVANEVVAPGVVPSMSTAPLLVVTGYPLRATPMLVLADTAVEVPFTVKFPLVVVALPEENETPYDVVVPWAVPVTPIFPDCVAKL